MQETAGRREFAPNRWRTGRLPLNDFHLLRRFSRLRNCDLHRTFVVSTCTSKQKRISRGGDAMALVETNHVQTSHVQTNLIQTNHDNVVRLVAALQPDSPIRRVARWIARRCEVAGVLLRRRLEVVAQWSAKRRGRTRLSMAERARQRRALEQLTDRELRDIGITRYDIEFVLRRSSWR